MAIWTGKKRILNGPIEFGGNITITRGHWRVACAAMSLRLMVELLLLLLMIKLS
jgi:hypothetical protein